MEVAKSLGFRVLALLNARCRFEQGCAGCTEDATEEKWTPL
jgi:hypothetical protein